VVVCCGDWFGVVVDVGCMLLLFAVVVVMAARCSMHVGRVLWLTYRAVDGGNCRLALACCGAVVVVIVVAARCRSCGRVWYVCLRALPVLVAC